MNPYERLIKHSQCLILNANDFFIYACGDAVEVSDLNLEWMIPIIEKYENGGINAIMSYIRKQLPIKFWINPRFEEALKELNELKPEIYEL